MAAEPTAGEQEPAERVTAGPGQAEADYLWPAEREPSWLWPGLDPAATLNAVPSTAVTPDAGTYDAQADDIWPAEPEPSWLWPRSGWTPEPIGEPVPLPAGPAAQLPAGPAAQLPADPAAADPAVTGPPVTGPADSAGGPAARPAQPEPGNGPGRRDRTRPSRLGRTSAAYVGHGYPARHAPAGDQPGQRLHPRPARGLAGAALAVTAALGLVIAIVAGAALHARLSVRTVPRPRPAPASDTVARRWQTWPAGRIFPARLAYTTDLLVPQTASRIGISPADSCAAALAPRLRAAAARLHCQAGLRASYADQQQGVAYTLGVLAFPGPEQARSFLAGLPAGGRATSLQALAFRATASGRFTDAARQFGRARQAGPFVVIAVAGYADGRPATAAAPQYPAFAPASQLVTGILRPLATGCARQEKAC